jgi:hypothetical protein
VNKYVVQQDAWLYGKLCRKGETVEMTERQAKYYTSPHSTTLKLKTADRGNASAAPAAKPTGRKVRSGR